MPSICRFAAQLPGCLETLSGEGFEVTFFRR